MNSANTSSSSSSSGGRNPPYLKPSTWRSIAQPQVHPSPPRPRPTVFFYILSLIYSQSGLTRKFRHFMPCVHNVTYFGISDLNKRNLYAAGSECQLCPFCEETVISHIHLNVFHCPNDAFCPKFNKIPSTQVEGRIEHFCGSHQAVVPHPLDLNLVRDLPISFNAPTQFSYYSNIPNDSVSLVNSLYARHRTEQPGTESGPPPNPPPSFPPPRTPRPWYIPPPQRSQQDLTRNVPTTTVPVSGNSSITVTYPLLNNALSSPSGPPLVDLTAPPPTPERPRSSDVESENLQIVEPTEHEFSEEALNLSLRNARS